MKAKGCFVCVLMFLCTIIWLIGCSKNDGKLQMEATHTSHSPTQIGIETESIEASLTQDLPNLDDFKYALAQEDIDGMQMKIYYISPSILTYAPLSVDDLIHSDMTNIIIVDNVELNKYANLLHKIDMDNFVPVEQTGKMHARMCFIFETDSLGKVLEIVFCGEINNVFLNGFEVQQSDIFAEIVEPFVTEEEMEMMGYLFRGDIYVP